MAEKVQIKATIPHDLKRLAFACFAQNDVKFTGWLRTELQRYVNEATPQHTQGEPHAQQR